VIDISDAAAPRRVGGNSVAGDMEIEPAMAAVGDHIYLAGRSGLVVLNLFQPPRLEAVRLDARDSTSCYVVLPGR